MVLNALKTANSNHYKNQSSCLGFGRYNVFLILICGFLLFAVTTETFGVGFVVPAAECELDLDNYTKGILTSANFVGLVAGAPFWGYLSDLRGRRKLLISNLVLAFLSGIIASVTPSFWGYSILRFINGICHDLLPASGWLLLQTTFSVEFLGFQLNNWRTFSLANSVPSIIVALMLYRLPESPRYLYYSGKPKEALIVLRDMYVSNTGNPKDSFPVESLDEKAILEQSSRSKKDLSAQIVPLFKPPLLSYTVSACVMQASAFAVCSGLLFWYPDIINQISKTGKTDVTVCEALSFGGLSEAADEEMCTGVVDDRVFILNIIIGVYYFVLYTTWGIVVKIIGTRYFFIFCMATAAVSTLLICFLSQKILIDIFFVTALTLPGVGVSIINTWVVEIFPTNIGGMALCTTLTAGRLGSIISSSMAGILLEWNCLTTFLLYGLMLIATAPILPAHMMTHSAITAIWVGNSSTPIAPTVVLAVIIVAWKMQATTRFCTGVLRKYMEA
ncbi:hypothetical protein NQ317_008370, partial [Molorchus minor]